MMSKSNEFKEIVPENMQRFFDDLVFALMRHGGIDKIRAEKIVRKERIKLRKIRISYIAMTNVARNSFVSQYALNILDELGGRGIKSVAFCKKCGVDTSPSSHWGYCDKCNEGFNAAIRNGALVLYNGSFHAESKTWEIKRYSPDKPDLPVLSETYSDFSVFQAIVKVRKIAKKKRIDEIVCVFLPTHSQWFLDEYLEAHLNLKDAVERSEKSIFEKFKEYISTR